MSTVVLMIGITAFLAMVAMLYVWRVHHREPAVRYWALAFLVLGSGVVLVGLRTQLPDVLSIVVGKPLILGGLMLMYAGTSIFVGYRPSRVVIIAVPLVASIGFAYWSMVAPSFAARVLLFSLASCVSWVLMIRVLLANPRDPQRFVYRFVAAVCALSILTSLTRSVATVLNPDATHLFGGGAADVVWFVMGYAIVFFSPFSFLLMTSQRLELRLERLANEDQLTGTLNRRAFLSRAWTAIPQWEQGMPASVLVLDIDGFKAFNDEHGHDAGDAVLHRFAQAVKPHLRKEDLFARAGGEEFWLLLPDTDPGAARTIGERLRAAVEAAEVMYNGKRLHVTVSVGVAALTLGDLSGAITLADRALYAAKVQGRNRVVVAGESPTD
jgi:diguanylate cyclase (GGDEF)-like protein